jgi:UDP:flavonoid glycosyltransferase YjiC (YdhE family)
MAHFLLAWELGANLGHATRLRSIALGLKARGHRVSLALRDLVGPRELLGAGLGPVFQAPLLINQVSPPAWSMADILLSCGFESARTLGGLTEAWENLLALSGCDVLVADHSPVALLAARLAGVPAVHVGSGFFIPPRQTPLPIFRDWASAPASHAALTDARALASANTLLAARGAPLLPRLCELFYPQQTLLCGWPELDHYAGAGREPTDYLGPDCEFQPGVAPAWPEAPGPRVFAYLRGSHPEHTELLRALDALGCATECFFPDREQVNADARVESRHVHYSAEPVDMQEVLSTCALVVCHAGQATVAQAMRAGVPCLLLPTQAEQFLLARQAERFGVGINAASLARPVDYRALIAELTQPGGPRLAQARSLARKYQHFDPLALTARIVAAAESLAPAG